jgi:S-(hydroxymethyl)glutathione dehydrogenase / alcohol dehydrogenase
MKAAILVEINAPLAVCDVELTELKVGQVLVKVLVSGLCGAQLHEIRGHKGNAKFLPHLMGHEGCGVVEAVGDGVTTVKVGDKVVMHWRPGTGIEAPFPSYVLDGKSMSSGKVTTLSEYSIVSENRLTTVPQDTPPELCAILGCALTTAMGIIDNEVDLKFGESVAVIGTGGVGLNLIQAAAMKSACPIIAVDNNPTKKQMCLDVGASKFYTSIDQIEEKVDIVIDTTGISEVITQGISILSNTGRMILVGQPAPGKFVTVMNAVNLFNGIGHSIKATQGGKTNPQEDIPRYIRLHKEGLLDVSKLITHTFTLDQINQAFDLLKSGNAGRIMIKIAEETV